MLKAITFEVEVEGSEMIAGTYTSSWSIIDF
jgi:hypothetical protein